MGAVVRSAVPADLERVLAIARNCGTPAQWPEKEYTRIFTPDPHGGHRMDPLGAYSRLVLVIGEEQQVQGFIIGRLAGDQWEIENIAVERNLQRRGLGRQLLRAFLERARQRGSAVFLEVRESNLAARNLYSALGFVPAGRRKAYYRTPEEDAVVLKLSF